MTLKNKKSRYINRCVLKCWFLQNSPLKLYAFAKITNQKTENMSIWYFSPWLFYFGSILNLVMMTKCLHTLILSVPRVCVREKEEWERPTEIERKVSGQRLSEIYPHSEACKREDAGSWGPEIRAQTWVISTQTPVREAAASRLRPTHTGGNKTHAGKEGEEEKKDTIWTKPSERKLLL